MRTALLIQLIDSSVLIAAANPSDNHHSAAAPALSGQNLHLRMPITILAETMSFVGSRLGIAKQRALWDAVSNSNIELIGVDADLLAAAREIDRAYEDAAFGFADSVLLACCEHLRCACVLSLDRKLALYRPTFAEHLELLP